MRVYIKQGRFGSFRIYNERKDAVLFNVKWSYGGQKELQLLFTDAEETGLLSIKSKHKKWFRWAWDNVYSLTLLTSNREFEIRSVSYYQQHWRMIDPENTEYDYYAHGGYLKSIFRNNVQVAKVDLEPGGWFESGIVYIDLNNDEDPLLLAGFVLAQELHGDYDTPALAPRWILNPSARKYFKNWKPK
jgi:hypothetical protein